MPRKLKGAPTAQPWLPPDYDELDINAVKALAAGTAHEGQQKHALQFIVHVLAGTYDQSFRPDAAGGARASDFAEGRRFVGLQLVKLTKLTTPAKPDSEPTKR